MNKKLIHNIDVAVRLRPLNKHEIDDQQAWEIKQASNADLTQWKSMSSTQPGEGQGHIIYLKNKYKVLNLNCNTNADNTQNITNRSGTALN